MFRICWNDIVIGHTAYEHADPPMGVLIGRMVPSEALIAFRAATPPQARNPETGAFSREGLTARTATGTPVLAEGAGPGLFDQDGARDCKVTAVGI